MLLLLPLLLLKTGTWGKDSYVAKLFLSIWLILAVIPIAVFRLHISQLTLSDIIYEFNDSSLFAKISAVILLIAFFIMIISIPFIT